jgi:hypothetical protein
VNVTSGEPSVQLRPRKAGESHSIWDWNGQGLKTNWVWSHFAYPLLHRRPPALRDIQIEDFETRSPLSRVQICDTTRHD